MLARGRRLRRPLPDLARGCAARRPAPRLSGEAPAGGTTARHGAVLSSGCRGSRRRCWSARALAAAGAAYQGLFRNPLVSPDILGVSAGAGLGAVLGIFLSLPVLGIQLLAFARRARHRRARATLIAAAVRGREPVLVLVLAGVVVGALAGSAISLLKVLADPYDQLPAITFWLLGSLAAINARATSRPRCRSAAARPRAAGAAALADQRALARRRGGAARSASTPRRLRVVVIAAATLDDRERGRDRRHRSAGSA